MTSQKQFDANRRNAKRSTGPVTQTGKARSRKNAYKHGLTAETLIIGEEEAEEFDAFREKMMASFAPSSTMEHELVDRLVGLAWRLRRLPAFEAAVIAANIQKAEDDRQQGLEDRETLRAESKLRLTRLLEQYPHLASAQDEEANQQHDASDSRHSGGAAPSEESAAKANANARGQKNAGLMRLGWALLLDGQEQDALARLQRYEIGLVNQFERTLKQLAFVQTHWPAADGQGPVLDGSALPPKTDL